MKLRLRAETIKQHTEEAACDTCGAPLYVGDRAFYDLDRGAVYCGRKCAQADAPPVLKFPPVFDKAA